MGLNGKYIVVWIVTLKMAFVPVAIDGAKPPFEDGQDPTDLTLRTFFFSKSQCHNAVLIVCLTVCSGADQRKFQSSTSLAFVRGIQRWLVDSPNKGPVTRKMFPFHDVIMIETLYLKSYAQCSCFVKGYVKSFQWRHNERVGVSNHQPHDCLLNRLFKVQIKETSSSASLAFVRRIHRWPMNSPQKGPVTWKMFPFDDVIMFPVKIPHTVPCYFTGTSTIMWTN